MGKIIDRLTELEKTGSPSVSFEFFPAKTEDGVFNLLNRVEEMGFQLQPTFVTLTWRSAFKDEKLWLKIGSHIQNEFKIDVLMHLTCHLPREQLREILKNVRAAGIRNILALRGDPPIGSERWKAIPGGFQNAVELIRFIREEHGDWFCIAAAGYAEVHTEAWNNPNLPPSDQVRRVDMLRLKEKQDAGADFIITQFFFDVDKLLQWIRDCRQVGITIPILPGYLPIQTYNSFLKFTNWCKTSVPPQVEDALVTIKNDDSAVKKYGIQLAVDTCRKLLANNLSLHFYTMNLATTVRTVLEGLHLIERERGLPWGAPITRSKDGTLEKSIEQLPWCEQGLSGESTIIRENLRWINSMGFLTINSQPRINGAPSEDPSVGWGGKDGFVFQKAYVEFFVPPHLMQRLVVRDIFKIFARVITESMTKDDLRQRVLELEGKNEKLHETVAKLKIIQAEANRELKDLHGDLSTSREENSRLKAQVRELRSRLAMAEL
ncbi:hypothetical protein DYB28_002293 [Aphanomyces astaci]|uniref:MTHFR SAM-binding regulatory domain-containing protein n=1 Tax=Aphanomyces astaci TaxID=112090 RepID=A0A9X8HA44_APHAT|nr:hypothetical protein DYB28_002293 [Aphanomyces astaci]